MTEPENAARMVYVVTMVGVYDHGCGGVFTTREAAEGHARAMADDSDGYHDFRIDEVPLDVPIWLDRRKPSWRGDTKIRTPEVSFEGWKS